MNTTTQFPALNGATELPALAQKPPAAPPKTQHPAQKHPLGPVGHKHPLTGKRC